MALVQADLGRLLFDMGRADEGRRMLELAREAQEKFVAARCSWRWTWPDTYTTLANLHEAEGRPKEALSFYEKAAAIYEKLAAERATVYFRAELARALNNLGLARAKSGQLREGLRDVERGKEIRERLLSGQPLNIDPRADLARSWYHLARIQILIGAAVEAIASIQQSRGTVCGHPAQGAGRHLFPRLHEGPARRADRGRTRPKRELSSSERSERQHLADEAMALLKQAIGCGLCKPESFPERSAA